MNNLEKFDKTVDSLESELNDLTKIAEVYKKVADLDEKISQSVAELNGSITEMKEVVSVANEAKTALDSAVEKVGNIEAVNTSITTLATKVGEKLSTSDFTKGKEDINKQVKKSARGLMAMMVALVIIGLIEVVLSVVICLYL